MKKSSLIPTPFRSLYAKKLLHALDISAKKPKSIANAHNFKEIHLSSEEIEFLEWNWEIWARDDQLAPDQSLKPWRNWVLMGGRGAGKTRAGAEWVRQLALGKGQYQKPLSPIALVGETHHDVRSVMVEGQSGILAAHPDHERPVFEPSLRKLTWKNGSVAQLFSAEDSDSLRGPQFAAAWCDELCKWQDAAATWDMLQFGLRLGAAPQVLITTTPRPLKLLQDILSLKTSILTHASTFDNAANLAEGFIEHMQNLYDGTRLGRQELYGEIVAQNQGALFQHDEIDRYRVKTPPPMKRIIVAIDPAVTSKKTSDHTGIVVVGLGEDDHGYILQDASIQGVNPLIWAQKSIEIFESYQADSIICESNQGGDLINTLFLQLNSNIPIKKAHANRGKYARAEPVAALYSQGRVHHVNTHGELEDEMCSFTIRAGAGNKSPDRLDALVWGITELMIGNKTSPQIRAVT